MQLHFVKMLQHLRYYEEVILYANLLEISGEEEAQATKYLKSEYETERLEYPFVTPSFNDSAALWAAKTVYIASQLLLYRQNRVEDLPSILPNFPGEISPSAILSADITLRFLPSVITQLQLIDPDDELINILKNHLQTWHYSGISSSLLNIETLSFDAIITNKCLHQLYVDRVIVNKKLALVHHPALENEISSTLGIYTSLLWKEFKKETSLKHE